MPCSPSNRTRNRSQVRACRAYWSAPYAESSWLIVATVLALTIYGFRTTLAGRTLAVTRLEPQTSSAP
jgi:hypothetical protein